MATASSDSRSRTPSATVLAAALENFLAHRVVDFGQRGEVEIDAEQFDQARALLRLERFQQGAEVGFVQVADQRAQRAGVGRLDRLARRCSTKVVADGAVVVARHVRGLGVIVFLLIEHAGIRDCRTRAACTPGLASRANY